MKIQLRERTVPPDRDQEILDVLGPSGSMFALSMLQALTVCVKVVSLDGRLMFVNQVGLDELMGGSLDEVRDTLWSSHWPRRARPTLEEALELCAGGRHLTCEVLCPTEDGEDRMWSIDLSPILGRSGDMLAILVLSRDTTANTNLAPRLRSE